MRILLKDLKHHVVEYDSTDKLVVHTDDLTLALDVDYTIKPTTYYNGPNEVYVPTKQLTDVTITEAYFEGAEIDVENIEEIEEYLTQQLTDYEL